MAGQRWGGIRMGVVLAMVAGITTIGSTHPVIADGGDDVVEACEPLTAAPEIGPRACSSVQAGAWLAAQGCRRVEGLREPVCPTLDGRPVHAAAMDAFEASWLARALKLQRGLDDNAPLSRALLPHTHNSANSTAYAPSLSKLDANQVLTITDQLRLGMRAIEIDVHWTQHLNGDPEHQMRAVVQCHGEPVGTPAGGLHAGCSVDTLLVDLLHELRAWLDQPANADEVVLLYLENALDGDPAAHEAAVTAIDAALGNLVARPAGGEDCQPLPVHVTKQQLVDAGTPVLITGNCGPGDWNARVFDRYPAWHERGGSSFDCTDERRDHADFDDILVRRYEDSTWLSAMAGSGSHLDAATIASMVQCGVNLVGFDQLHPGDDRLPGLVWSWRTNEPSPAVTNACAAQGPDGRFFADADCSSRRHVACRTASGAWAISAEADTWDAADDRCVADGHVAAGVPVNGWDNAALRAVADEASVTEVWLDYAQDAAGTWARTSTSA